MPPGIQKAAFALAVVAMAAGAAGSVSADRSTGTSYGKDQCKNGGWQSTGFKNQGDCVSFFATGGKNPPG